jgi:hypothetical protein
MPNIQETISMVQLSTALLLSAVENGFEPRLGPTKDDLIDICCFSA